MSDDEDCGEIKLKHTVANLNIYDSDEEETDDDFEEPDFMEVLTVWGCVEGTRKYGVVFLMFRPKKCHIS